MEESQIKKLFNDILEKENEVSGIYIESYIRENIFEQISRARPQSIFWKILSSLSRVIDGITEILGGIFCGVWGLITTALIIVIRYFFLFIFDAAIFLLITAIWLLPSHLLSPINEILGAITLLWPLIILLIILAIKSAFGKNSGKR